MKNRNFVLGVFTVLLIGVVFFFRACSEKKETNEEPLGIVTVKMTDSVADYKAVNVEVKAIHVHYALEDSLEKGDSLDGSYESWYTLPTHSGIYNLLDFQNGKDTVLANGELPEGFISQIRLELGDNNSLYMEEDTVDLTIPSGTSSGYKININQKLRANDSLVFLFDFDAGSSIIAKGNGSFMLKPVLHLKNGR